MEDELRLEAPGPSGDAPVDENYGFGVSDIGVDPRGISIVCGWCMGAVGASGECERGCVREGDE